MKSVFILPMVRRRHGCLYATPSRGGKAVLRKIMQLGLFAAGILFVLALALGAGIAIGAALALALKLF